MPRVVCYGFKNSFCIQVLTPDRLFNEVIEALSKSIEVLIVGEKAWLYWVKFRDYALEHSLNWLLLEAVDVREERVSGIPLEKLVAARLTLLGKSARRKPATIIGGVKVSRRELLHPQKLVKYVDVVYVKDPSLCAYKACPLCNVCPYDALEGAPPRISAYRCTGCGLCLNFCPHNNLSKYSTDPQTLWDYLRLLEPNKPVVFACRDSINELLDKLQDTGFEAVVVPVNSPCEATLDVLLAVTGLTGYTPSIYCPGASSVHGREAVEKYLETIIRDYTLITGATPSFNPIDEPPKRLIEPVHGLSSEVRQAALQTAAKLLEARGVDAVETLAPLTAWVEIDEDKCTMCYACTTNCRYNALTVKRGGSLQALIHNPLSCRGCMVCSVVCPENAIRVYKRVSRATGERVLVKRGMVQCIYCGKYFAPYKLVVNVVKRLHARGFDKDKLLPLLLCPECRGKLALGLIELNEELISKANRMLDEMLGSRNS